MLESPFLASDTIFATLWFGFLVPIGRMAIAVAEDQYSSDTLEFLAAPFLLGAFGAFDGPLPVAARPALPKLLAYLLGDGLLIA